MEMDAPPAWAHVGSGFGVSSGSPRAVSEGMLVLVARLVGGIAAVAAMYAKMVRADSFIVSVSVGWPIV